MQRVIVPPEAVRGDTVTIDDPGDVHHLLRVLRVKVGAPLECVDGHGHRYRGRISRCARSGLMMEIRERFQDAQAGAQAVPRLVLGQAIIRPERFEWIVEKATELGVGRISPLVTERTVIRLSGDQAERKRQRWARIAREATAQCGRSVIPTVDSPSSLEAFLDSLTPSPMIFIPTLAVNGSPLREALEARGPTASAVVLIGPEGDFTRGEVEMARRHGAVPVSLGRATLRAETAAIAVLAILRYALKVGE